MDLSHSISLELTQTCLKFGLLDLVALGVIQLLHSHVTLEVSQHLLIFVHSLRQWICIHSLPAWDCLKVALPSRGSFNLACIFQNV